jgi:hypothetical protein
VPITKIDAARAPGPHPSSPRGTSFHRSVKLEFPSIGFDAVEFSCCGRGLFPGPTELGAIHPYAVHDHSQPMCQGYNRFFHPAAPGDLHRPGLAKRCADGARVIQRRESTRDAQTKAFLLDGGGPPYNHELSHGRAPTRWVTMATVRHSRFEDDARRLGAECLHLRNQGSSSARGL